MRPTHARASSLQQGTAAAILLCVLIHLTSGFSIPRNSAAIPHSARVKRGVYPSYSTLCKANARNCDPTALVDRRSQSKNALSTTPFGSNQQLSQDQQTDDVLRHVLQSFLSSIWDMKPAPSVICKSSPKMVCSSDTTTAGPGKRADHRVFWNRLLQNAKASYGLPVARQARYEDRLSQKLSPADLMEKLQLGLSNWRRAEARLAQDEPDADFEKSATEEEFIEPW